MHKVNNVRHIQIIQGTLGCKIHKTCNKNTTRREVFFSENLFKTSVYIVNLHIYSDKEDIFCQ